MTTEYKIIAFDEKNAQVTLRVADMPPIVVDLPIDGTGNIVIGDQLKQYLSGFVPSWHIERQKRIANGIGNLGAIRRMVEPEPVVEPTVEELAAQVRNHRDMLMQASDWTGLNDANLTSAEKAAWVEYRQALRDIPQQEGFPTNVVWPTLPN